ncbi:hypothetical protein A5893_02580 [Pedobacter psychrophilus]|uniref:HTH luxR-type domain-containing protein n=1 Tax=Pedobacter psychrophilus TaxID=1826909 RepID=A0A179DMR7_9SPHI|nr:RNA polymerase sigma-70 factor [Pedobacter psychrophilus]OAQ42020.1 hypothetical protein A5893_02580 [Pedobacter psychrophilus]
MYSNKPCAQCEDDLTEQLNKGSEKAFQVFYERYQNRIFYLALRYLKCESQAEEVVQEVFMKLWLHHSEMQIGKPIEAWLYTVGKHNILNRIKKQANFWKVLDQLKKNHSFEDNSMEEKFQFADYELILNNTLKSLSNKQLVVYNMARKDNLSYHQISKKLDISPLTVKTHMSRALCHIRSVIFPLVID